MRYVVTAFVILIVAFPARASAENLKAEGLYASCVVAPEKSSCFPYLRGAVEMLMFYNPLSGSFLCFPKEGFMPEDVRKTFVKYYKEHESDAKEAPAANVLYAALRLKFPCEGEK